MHVGRFRVAASKVPETGSRHIETENGATITVGRPRPLHARGPHESDQRLARHTGLFHASGLLKKEQNPRMTRVEHTRRKMCREWHVPAAQVALGVGSPEMEGHENASCSRCANTSNRAVRTQHCPCCQHTEQNPLSFLCSDSQARPHPRSAPRGPLGHSLVL